MTDPTSAARPVDDWLVRFGDIAASRHWLSTPAGVTPLTGSTFELTDRTVVVTRTPTWAVVVAIVGFFVIFVLSLLFLLVRETAPAGTIDVTVRNDGTGASHTVSLGVSSPGDVADVYARVAYAQQLAAAA